MQFSGITDPWLRKHLERMNSTHSTEGYRDHLRHLLWECNNEREKSAAAREIVKELMTRLENTVPKEQHERDIEALTKICELQSQLIGELRQRAKAYEMHPTEVAILNWLARTTPYHDAVDRIDPVTA